MSKAPLFPYQKDLLETMKAGKVITPYAHGGGKSLSAKIQARAVLSDKEYEGWLQDFATGCAYMTIKDGKAAWLPRAKVERQEGASHET